MAICNCIPNNGTTSIPANPDVAGLGVLVAFAVTAGITFLALVIGWATDSVADDNLNGIDRLLVARMRRPFIRENLISNAASYTNPVRKKLRVQGLERFVLSLSDQQLVTGIAMLIAGYINPCLMDLHHFRMVRALIWFSSLTHLSTLALLRKYMIEHPVVRTWRVIAMVLLGVGLVFAVWVSSVGGDPTLPAICVWNLPKEPEGVNHLAAVIFCFLALFLVFAYGNNIIGLYTNDPHLSLVEWAIKKVKARIMCTSAGETRRCELGNANTAVPAASDPRGCGKQKDLIRFSRRFGNSDACGTIARIRRGLVLGFYVQREISESFLNNILWLVFGNLYGIFQILQTRDSAVTIEGNENQMTFGQVVSLLLLGLPLLTVGEVYYEVHDEVKRMVINSVWSPESSAGIPFRSYSSPAHERGDAEKDHDGFAELSMSNDIESGTSNAEKQNPALASPGPSATITSLGVTSQDQGEEYEKDALLTNDQQRPVMDPYELSGFKLYMIGIILFKLGLYVIYAFALSLKLQAIGLIIVTALVAAPAILSSVWQFLGLLHVCVIAGLNGVRKVSHLG